jgi:hypothetical protein
VIRTETGHSAIGQKCCGTLLRKGADALRQQITGLKYAELALQTFSSQPSRSQAKRQTGCLTLVACNNGNLARLAGQAGKGRRKEAKTGMFEV